MTQDGDSVSSAARVEASDKIEEKLNDESALVSAKVESNHGS